MCIRDRFELKNQNNSSISPDILKGRVAVVNFLSENDSIAKYQADRIGKVQQNYRNTDDVLFLTFIHSNENITLLNKASELGISDHKRWFLLGTENEEWKNLSSNGFKIKDINKDVVLVDTSMTIRRHYDIYSNPEMDRLVEQIAIVIPKQVRRGM